MVCYSKSLREKRAKAIEKLFPQRERESAGYSLLLEFKGKLKNLMFDLDVAEKKKKSSFGCRVFSRTHLIISCCS